MKLLLLKNSTLTLASAAFAMSIAGQATAQDTWQWSADIYGWMPSIDSGLLSGNDTEITFDDILDNLDFAAMGVIQAKKGKLSVFTDLIYLDLGDNVSGTIDVGGAPIPAGVSADMKSYIGNFGVGYTLSETATNTFGAYGGARYFQLDYSLKGTAGPIQKSVSDSQSTWDAIVGIRGQADINENWYVHYLADVGGGGSDLTWQVLGAVGYRLENFDLTVGYRHIAWELDDFGPFDTVDVSGPFVGVRFVFD